MRELGLNAPQLARRAGVDPTTVRAFLAGRRWPQPRTRARLARALGWQVGDGIRLAVDSGRLLEQVPTRDLIKELCRRVDQWSA